VFRKCFGLPDPDPIPVVRGKDLDQISKNNKKYLDFYCFFFLLYDFLSLKNDVNAPSKTNKEKNLDKKVIFVGSLKDTYEKSRNRILIR
jgi:hypothetical protein